MEHIAEKVTDDIKYTCKSKEGNCKMINNKNQGSQTKHSVIRLLSLLLSIALATISCFSLAPLTARADKTYTYTRTDNRLVNDNKYITETITADQNETVYIVLSVQRANGGYTGDMHNAIVDITNGIWDSVQADGSGHLTRTFTITYNGNASDTYQYQIRCYELSSDQLSSDVITVTINWTDPIPAPVVQNTEEPIIQEPEGKLPPCEHNYEWRVITEATATADGVECYVCTKCGDVKERRGLAALGVFEDQTSDEVLNAPANGTINIECMPWNSFGHAVKEAMAKRPDVTIKASFLSKGHTGIPLKVTIPAGRVDLFDSNGYLGLCRAGTELGYDQ